MRNGCKGRRRSYSRLGLSVHNADDFLELTADFLNNALCSIAHRLHGESGENKGQAGADHKTDKHGGFHNAEVYSFKALNTELVDVGRNKREGGECRRAYCKALTGGGGGISEGIEGVGTLSDLGIESRHFGDTAGVIGNRAVGVGGKGYAEGGKHSHGGKRHAVEAEISGTLRKAAGENNMRREWRRRQ